MVPVFGISGPPLREVAPARLADGSTVDLWSWRSVSFEKPERYGRGAGQFGRPGKGGSQGGSKRSGCVKGDSFLCALRSDSYYVTIPWKIRRAQPEHGHVFPCFLILPVHGGKTEPNKHRSILYI